MQLIKLVWKLLEFDTFFYVFGVAYDYEYTMFRFNCDSMVEG